MEKLGKLSSRSSIHWHAVTPKYVIRGCFRATTIVIRVRDGDADKKKKQSIRDDI